MTDGRGRRRKTLDDIDAEIARLKEQRRELRIRSAERFSRIALETGLADLGIPDEEIELAFKSLVNRFRSRSADTDGPADQAPSPA